MNKENTNPRRQFLKNTSLAALAIGLMPRTIKAIPGADNPDECFYTRCCTFLLSDRQVSVSAFLKPLHLAGDRYARG